MSKDPITNATKLISIPILRFLETFAHIFSEGFNFNAYAQYKNMHIGIIMMTIYEMLKILKIYRIGHIKVVTTIKMIETIEGIFFPYRIGKVLAPSNLSPSMSSISLTISRAKVMNTANRPKYMEMNKIFNEFVAQAMTVPAITKQNPVKVATVIFPIKGIALRFLAYKYMITTAGMTITEDQMELTK